eukprot:TRINITY_DN816_c0_g1_i1.p1 TRINITY_DN816_c0_g1~~TRINITY_DN816_c0_g1_i1.p1  ORF type:complete len:382 (+),score=129.82 TRINITY_DN816_c0_g1_i1:1047-2192(+)
MSIQWLADILVLLPESIVSLVVGLIPSLVIVIFFAILEPILIFMVSFQRLLTTLENKRTILHLWFIFLIINVLLVSCLATTIIGAWDELQKFANPLEVIRLLATTLPSQANYFMDYVMTSTMSAAVSLFRPQFLALRLFMLICFKLTKREKLTLDNPDEFDYMYNYGYHSLMFTLVLTYLPIAPLIAPFGVFYFAYQFFIFGYNVLYVHKKSHEEGHLWTVTASHMFVGIIISQVLLCGIFLLKGFTGGMVIVCVTFAITLVLWMTITSYFDPVCKSGALVHVAGRKPPHLSALPEHLVRAFVQAYMHPATHALPTSVVTDDDGKGDGGKGGGDGAAAVATGGGSGGGSCAGSAQPLLTHTTTDKPSKRTGAEKGKEPDHD